MKSKKWRVVPMALYAVLPFVAGSAQAEIAESTFLLRNSGDLADLCTATPSDRLYTAARNFCEGFAVGVFRVLQEQDMARQSGKMFCLPDPAPTRDAAIAAWVQWIKAEPKRSEESPADGIASYLAQQYPCPRDAKASRRERQ